MTVYPACVHREHITSLWIALSQNNTNEGSLLTPVPKVNSFVYIYLYINIYIYVCYKFCAQNKWHRRSVATGGAHTPHPQGGERGATMGGWRFGGVTYCMLHNLFLGSAKNVLVVALYKHCCKHGGPPIPRAISLELQPLQALWVGVEESRST